MRRGVWFAAGIGAGVYGMVRARRVAEALTPDGARDRLAGLKLGVRMMAEEFTAAHAEREAELRERFGLVPDATATPQLTPRATQGRPAGTITAAPPHADATGLTEAGHREKGTD